VVLEDDGTKKRKMMYYIERRRRRNILQTIERRKANWIGHILRRNCFLKHIIKGKINGRP
jgi:hypothetical protein